MDACIQLSDFDRAHDLEKQHYLQVYEAEPVS